MIDIKLIRENRELVMENIKKKFQDQKLPLVDEVVELDEKIRSLKLEGDTDIKGEVHEYNNAIEVEKALDRIEGFITSVHKNNLYDKNKVLVETEYGTEECIVYEFARSIDQLEKVPEGVWII